MFVLILCTGFYPVIFENDRWAIFDFVYFISAICVAVVAIYVYMRYKNRTLPVAPKTKKRSEKKILLANLPEVVTAKSAEELEEYIYKKTGKRPPAIMDTYKYPLIALAKDDADPPYDKVDIAQYKFIDEMIIDRLVKPNEAYARVSDRVLLLSLFQYIPNEQIPLIENNTSFKMIDALDIPRKLKPLKVRGVQ